MRHNTDLMYEPAWDEGENLFQEFSTRRVLSRCGACGWTLGARAYISIELVRSLDSKQSSVRACKSANHADAIDA